MVTALATCSILLVVAVVLATLVGAVAIRWSDALYSAFDHMGLTPHHGSLSTIDNAVIWQLRFPRVLMAAMVGAMLALGGASYQGVFRNPLVDPYLLGAAAGAGLGATVVIVYYGGSDTGSFGVVPVVPVVAFVGAIMGVAMSYGLGMLSGAPRDRATLVLGGVAVTAFLTAVQTFVQQQHEASLPRVYAWILGELGKSDWSSVEVVAPYVLCSAVVLVCAGRSLDVLSVGDDKARSLGVHVGRVRLVVVVAASLGTAAVVAASGLIGFVGIIVPHVVRRIVGGSYRIVLPMSMLLGASFLVVADLVARTILAPSELPIGVVTAFFGAPFFAMLLRYGRKVEV